MSEPSSARTLTWILLVFLVPLTVTACNLSDDSPQETESTEAVIGSTIDPPDRPPTLPPSPTPLVDFENAVLMSIAEAEAEAHDWPAVDGPPDETAASGRYEGESERVCVDVQPGVSESGAWRSGDFVAGHFDVFLEERPKNPRYSKLWWSPVHNRPDLLAGVTVRAVRLDELEDARSTRVFHFEIVAWPESPDATSTPLPKDEYPDYFYPSGLELPSGGHWMLVATMGPNWGCFVIDLAHG